MQQEVSTIAQDRAHTRTSMVAVVRAAFRMEAHQTEKASLGASGGLLFAVGSRCALCL